MESGICPFWKECGPDTNLVVAFTGACVTMVKNSAIKVGRGERCAGGFFTVISPSIPAPGGAMWCVGGDPRGYA
ncbi:hypothetical protein [Roseibium sp. RKSG952]|uniref:hypothetical protein n=1 Tax=Roseibium sp. RKSG952 TaxID=2529384 RepID=UPI0012BB9385|nr:hypothetical protein [Roseibium sp. RKSG952]MTH97678.1 hypothetical protein [Roseibium sp. RKSG952]